MKIEGGNHAGDLPPPDEAIGTRSNSSLDQLAAWSIGTNAFVHRLDKTYKRWSRRPPNSPRQRKVFTKQLTGLVDDAQNLEGELRTIGNGLPDASKSRRLDKDDLAAVEVHKQLVASRFLDVWRRMVRGLEDQVADIQEPKTPAQWRAFFRHFNKVWKGAQDLGKAARAARSLLEELQLVPVLHSAGNSGLLRDDHAMLLKEISDTCGELVDFLVNEEILLDDDRPPTSSEEIVQSRGPRGGSAQERLKSSVAKLERYVDLVDRLILALSDPDFLRGKGDGEQAEAQLRPALHHVLECARSRYEIANEVFTAALQLYDPMFVAPGEALGHAREVRDVLQDLALQQQQFGKAIDRAAGSLTSRVKTALAWNDLDQVEQAIVRHLRLHPDSTRAEVSAAFSSHSPSTVWRRLRRLKEEGIIESARGERAASEVVDPAAMVRAKLEPKKAGKPAGGSAPSLFRLSPVGEGMRWSETDA